MESNHRNTIQGRGRTSVVNVFTERPFWTIQFYFGLLLAELSNISHFFKISAYFVFYCGTNSGLQTVV